MKLLGSPTSPYVRKVIVLAKETGLDGRFEVINASGTPIAPSAQTTAHNPLGKVPCLVRDDAHALFDSRVICEYLDSLHEGRKMFPAEGEPRWRAITLHALADGATDAALLAVYEHRLRPEGMRFAPFVDGQKAKVAQALAVIAERWMADLAAPMTIGHIAVAAMLGYVDFREVAPGWRDRHGALAAWFDAFSARPSMQSTMPA